MILYLNPMYCNVAWFKSKIVTLKAFLSLRIARHELSRFRHLPGIMTTVGSIPKIKRLLTVQLPYRPKERKDSGYFPLKRNKTAVDTISLRLG